MTLAELEAEALEVEVDDSDSTDVEDDLQEAITLLQTCHHNMNAIVVAMKTGKVIKHPKKLPKLVEEVGEFIGQWGMD